MKEMIDNALDDMHADHPLSGFSNRSDLTLRCVKIRDSDWFSQLITATILVVGVFIGVETDQVMR
jgi:hypothetical protein